jgi:hypothetical protein
MYSNLSDMCSRICHEPRIIGFENQHPTYDFPRVGTAPNSYTGMYGTHGEHTGQDTISAGVHLAWCSRARTVPDTGVSLYRWVWLVAARQGSCLTRKGAATPCHVVWRLSPVSRGWHRGGGDPPMMAPGVRWACPRTVDRAGAVECAVSPCGWCALAPSVLQAACTNVVEIGP